MLPAPLKFLNLSHMKEREQNETPQIIDEINKSLREPISEDMEIPTVESIARKIGINEKILYEWVKTDHEFSDALERLKNVQKDDPFKTGTEEDTYVNAMMIALLLFETRDRHYKSHNL